MPPQAKLQLQQTRQLAMTPGMRQVIQMLQLSQQELQALVEQSLHENPALEEADFIDPPQNEALSEDSWEYSETALPQNPLETLDTSWNEGETTELSVWEAYAKASAENAYSDPTFTSRNHHLGADHNAVLESTLPHATSMVDHLLWQVQITPMSKAHAAAARALITHIDDNGYLTTDLNTVLDTDLTLMKTLNGLLKPSPTKTENPSRATLLKLIEESLHYIHQFDPPACGSRGIEECLRIQLQQLQSTAPARILAQQIIDQHLPLLAQQNLSRIAKLCKVSSAEVMEARNLICTLEPKPGRHFSQHCAQAVIPDVYVVKVGGPAYETDDQMGEFRIILNDHRWTRLAINPSYTALCEKKVGYELDAEYALEKVRSAQNLIRSIEQRQKTLLKVTKSIVKLQYDFFKGGIAYLHPLILRDVADDIEVHESTVSRIANGKYIQMAQGVKELRFFFSSSVQQDTGGSISSHQIKQIIVNALQNESPTQPLTDSELVELLARQHRIHVSRRTVAKYRETLNIPRSNHRKRIF